MNKFLLIDLSNCFHRAKHVVHKQTTMEDRLGFCLHSSLGMIAKPWRMQKATHVVICLEGRSWRKDFYAPYKKNREVARMALTESEEKEQKLFNETYAELIDFLENKTNCTCLHHPILEADDLIAGWIQSHPDDEHVIVSSDTDYYQLISENVVQYNGITDETITLGGFINYKGKPVLDKKTKEPKLLGDPQWVLFEKCIRGDATDNVFSAFPGVRVKGSKNKPGLQEAYADRKGKGYAWNNVLLQRWIDHNGQEHKVIDDYNRNVTLIDLTAQPEHVKQAMAETIAAGSVHKEKPMVGAQFLRFCGKHQLVKLSEQAQAFSEILNTGYPS